MTKTHRRLSLECLEHVEMVGMVLARALDGRSSKNDTMMTTFVAVARSKAFCNKIITILRKKEMKGLSL